MEILAYVAPWVIASVFVGVGIGVFLGRSRGKNQANGAGQGDRQAVLKMLVEVLTSAEKINNDVESHNTELQENARQVENMEPMGEMDVVRDVLMGHMNALLQSNHRLQEDLVCTRYRLEEQAQEIDHVRHEARTDELTSVANRKAFNEKLHILIDDRQRLNEPFVLMLLDMDQFKRINDSHGHPAGDRVLSMVGEALKELVREGDFVGRYGGDEFATLLPKTQLDVGLERAELIRVKMAEWVSRGASRDGEIAVSVSIGVVACEIGDTAESLLKRADQALYRCKDLGRNQIQFSGPTTTPDCKSCPV
jgi:diguanylate cyclase